MEFFGITKEDVSESFYLFVYLFYLFVCLFVCFSLQLPAIRIIHLSDDMKKYRPDFQEIEAEKLRGFVQGFLDGTLAVREREREGGGRERGGEREGGREREREGEREREREREREGEREREREGGRERGREGGRERGREGEGEL